MAASADAGARTRHLRRRVARRARPHRRPSPQRLIDHLSTRCAETGTDAPLPVLFTAHSVPCRTIMTGEATDRRRSPGTPMQATPDPYPVEAKRTAAPRLRLRRHRSFPELEAVVLRLPEPGRRRRPMDRPYRRGHARRLARRRPYRRHPPAHRLRLRPRRDPLRHRHRLHRDRARARPPPLPPRIAQRLAAPRPGPRSTSSNTQLA